MFFRIKVFVAERLIDLGWLAEVNIDYAYRTVSWTSWSHWKRMRKMEEKWRKVMGF